jgi:hypothetical protein
MLPVALARTSARAISAWNGTAAAAAAALFKNDRRLMVDT